LGLLKPVNAYDTAAAAAALLSNPLDLQDMYDVLRPGLVRFISFADASAAVSDILSKEAAASASGLEPIDEEDDEDDSDEEVRGEGGGGGALRQGGG